MEDQKPPETPGSTKQETESTRSVESSPKSSPDSTLYPERKRESLTTQQEILAQIQELQHQLNDLREADHPQNVSLSSLAKEPLSSQDEESSSSCLQSGFKPPASPANIQIVPFINNSESSSKLIIVSNRLPVSILPDTNPANPPQFRVSSGGLVSALAGVKSEISFVWVGWTGSEVSPQHQTNLATRLEQEHACFPVYLSEDLAELYYNGFCNDVLWPLFHYIPLPPINADKEKRFDPKFFRAYITANQLFAEAVRSIYCPGDIIWVQDYHLMLLPTILRKKDPHMLIGFFLHTPFPASDIFRVLPMHKEILQGVLDSDLIGFHTYDYCSHFLSACARLLGLETSHTGVSGHSANRFAHVRVCPIGIDPSSFIHALRSETVKERIQELKQRFQGRRIILGVDRMDYTKGIPHKLRAFERLLSTFPNWRENKVVLIQIAVPSRIEVSEYRKLLSQTNELVGGINGKYGTVDYSPIVFINQSVSFHDLCALYSVADVCLVTPIRDGMNLVSYEYVICQNENHGVLVLSEFAGSAHSLSGAIRVNPWNTEQVCSALHEALSLDKKERAIRHWKLYRYVTTYTAVHWAKTFVHELQDISKKLEQELLEANQKQKSVRLDVQKHIIDNGWKNVDTAINELHGGKTHQCRLLIFNFEGTLYEAKSLSGLISPSPNLMTALQHLSEDKSNLVFIVSDRSTDVLESIFGHLSVGLIAENGSLYRRPDRSAWIALGANSPEVWFNEVIPILQYFTERTPGSVLEMKRNTLAWHFQDCDREFGSWQAFELREHLAEICAFRGVDAMIENRTMLLEPIDCSKKNAMQSILSDLNRASIQVCFVFALSGGKSKCDDEMFEYLKTLSSSTTMGPPSGETSTISSSNPITQSMPSIVICKVRKSSSLIADYFVGSEHDAVQLLCELAIKDVSQ